ncbi:T9SS type A sorting domain-containing protein [Chryseobacterium populi]|uniref:Por secretion system C-terminal sorting domain containing protein n=1 Tax=Chryseobacterium populi TaxID=1144316 RepID=J2JQ71_9FLAO|nr:T9SS type A sorting domain-containing protein [Chryseobacterium populi]EJL69965.1 Por secretion system C-terminal sorting domain containing protein [Chryseobacterium populi]
MNLTLKKIFWGIFFISIKLYSQEFYVNSILGTNTNKVYRLDISNTNQIDEPFCPPINGTFSETYTDIAIDGSNNIYYVTASGRLYRKNSSNSTCDFLGDFTLTNGSITSLTSDSGKYIYGTGSPNKLYRYDTTSGIFTDMGNLPVGQYIAGDLFFYDRRLFVSTLTGILEINMVTPSLSCPYMALGFSDVYAAFSINYGSYSKAYIIRTSFGGNSTLFELDMVNKQVGPPIRTYNYQINGAASIYSLISINSTCTPTPLAVQETGTSDTYFNVVNPVKNTIICNTNIDSRQIVSIHLFDSSGRLIKDFSKQSNLEKLDVSGLSDGIYLLTLSTKKGETYTKKIIINS